MISAVVSVVVSAVVSVVVSVVEVSKWLVLGSGVISAVVSVLVSVVVWSVVTLVEVSIVVSSEWWSDLYPGQCILSLIVHYE